MAYIQKVQRKKGVTYRVFIHPPGLKPITKTFATRREAVRFVIKLDDSINNKWPVVFHIEFRALKLGLISPEIQDEYTKDKYFNQLKNLLTNHPNHPFILMHMGGRFISV